MKQDTNSYQIIIKELRYFLLLILFLGTPKVNAYDFEVDGIYYNIISSDQVEVTYKNKSDRGYSGNVLIPQVVIYNDVSYHVTTIGTEAFDFCLELQHVTLPNSLKTIGKQAFSRCSWLESINIPNSVISIEQSAFSECSFLHRITIPNSVKNISRSAFWGCTGLSLVVSEIVNPYY